jgi:adenine-specific DNA methylase
MFESRLLRALDYAAKPFELKVVDKDGKKAGARIYDLSEAMGYECATTFAEFSEGKQVYLSCGDSSRTDLAEMSVDAVVTDPPFFDNVHYSQLADFFYVWQRHILGAKGCWAEPTTRSADEVQNGDVDAFTDRLGAVWKESYRLLKDNGLLVFTYHHSRGEGWRSVLKALMDASFGIVAAHPVKAEMSVAMPKQQTKEPINLDIIVVCRKLKNLRLHHWNGDLWGAVIPAATNQVTRLHNSGRSLSRNDVRIIVMAQLLLHLSVAASTTTALALLDANTAEIENVIDRLYVLRTKS